MEPQTEIQEINPPLPKQEWSKPELILISVNDDTLGVNHHGPDTYASST